MEKKYADAMIIPFKLVETRKLSLTPYFVKIPLHSSHRPWHNSALIFFPDKGHLQFNVECKHPKHVTSLPYKYYNMFSELLLTETVDISGNQINKSPACS